MFIKAKGIKNKILISLLMFLVFIIFGCNNNLAKENSDNPKPEPAEEENYSIQFDFEELSLELGETKSISAIVKNSKGDTVENIAVVYESSNNNLLAIDKDGNVQGKMIGDVDINANAKIDGKEISSSLNCLIVANALEFSSDNSFQIGSDTTSLNGVYSNKKSWDNVLYYYSYSDINWIEWDGTSEIDSYEVGDKSYLFLRGDGNTTFFNDGRGLHFYGENVSCKGDIRYLLNYNDIENAVMANDCFHSMFAGSPLISLPDLPFKMLTNKCYYLMFCACNSLVEVPRDYLPATTLADSCYSSMFANCISLQTPPALPATEVVDYCYSTMFSGCKSLTSIPYLGHITTDLNNTQNVFTAMFSGCEKISLARQKDDLHIYEYKLLPESNNTTDSDKKNYRNTFANTSKDIENGYWGMEISSKYYLRPDLNAPYYVSNDIIYPDEN